MTLFGDRGRGNINSPFIHRNRLVPNELNEWRFFAEAEEVPNSRLKESLVIREMSLSFVPRPDGPQISISNDFSTTLGGMVEEMATISLSSPVWNPPEVRNLAIEEGDFFSYLLLRLFGGRGWYE